MCGRENSCSDFEGNVDKEEVVMIHWYSCNISSPVFFEGKKKEKFVPVVVNFH